MTMTASQMGKKGGKAKTPAKVAAARENLERANYARMKKARDKRLKKAI